MMWPACLKTSALGNTFKCSKAIIILRICKTHHAIPARKYTILNTCIGITLAWCQWNLLPSKNIQNYSLNYNPKMELGWNMFCRQWRFGIHLYKAELEEICQRKVKGKRQYSTPSLHSLCNSYHPLNQDVICMFNYLRLIRKPMMRKIPDSLRTPYSRSKGIPKDCNNNHLSLLENKHKQRSQPVWRHANFQWPKHTVLLVWGN